MKILFLCFFFVNFMTNVSSQLWGNTAIEIVVLTPSQGYLNKVSKSTEYACRVWASLPRRTGARGRGAACSDTRSCAPPGCRVPGSTPDSNHPDGFCGGSARRSRCSPGSDILHVHHPVTAAEPVWQSIEKHKIKHLFIGNVFCTDYPPDFLVDVRGHVGV